MSHDADPSPRVARGECFRNRSGNFRLGGPQQVARRKTCFPPGERSRWPCGVAALFLVAALAIAGHPSPAAAQHNPWGERLPAPDALPPASSPAVPEASPPPASATHPPGTCEHCGRPTLFGRSPCLHCLRSTSRLYLDHLLESAGERARQGLQTLRDPRLNEDLINRLLQAKRELQDRDGRDEDFEKASRRQAIENIGRLKIGPNGQELNDLARTSVQRLLPALEGTDFAVDPSRTLSYFLILDGKGFIENVRFLRGPNGELLTLLEAVERTTKTDPAKAKDMLELMDNVRKLSDPDCQEQVPALLDSVARGLRLLTH